MVEQTDSIRRYILEKEYAFRGWKLLPFAVQYRQAPLTEFFTEASYKLIMDCDGVGFHDWMRGVDGAEKIVLDAINRCIKRGCFVSISMVLCKESVGCIRESVNLLASFGVSHVKIGSAAPLGEWTNEQEHFLSKEELFEAFLEYIPHYFEDGKPVSIGLEGFFSCDVPDGEPYALHEKNIDVNLLLKLVVIALAQMPAICGMYNIRIALLLEKNVLIVMIIQCVLLTETSIYATNVNLSMEHTIKMRSKIVLLY